MKSYWDFVRADEMKNQSLAEIISDWIINSGPYPVKIIQRLVGVTPDGRVGDGTLNAINNADQRWLFEEIKKEREKWYYDLVRRDPSQRKFLTGWLNRLYSFHFVDQQYPVESTELASVDVTYQQSNTRNMQ